VLPIGRLAFILRLSTSCTLFRLHPMRNAMATTIVFLSGFVIMVLEIIGARYLAKDFGSSFYVWTSQIGVILIALALGYYAGGALVDRWQRAGPLTWLLLPAGLLTLLIPDFTPRVIDAIVLRHPTEQDIPALWQRLDPVLGSAALFLMPCGVLAMLPPYMIRLASQRLGHVGRMSGLIYAASTVGGIAGVFVSAYVLLEHMAISNIFRAMGGLTLGLAVLCPALDRWQTNLNLDTDRDSTS